MLLSNDFDIVKPSHARQIYQDMTRYIQTIDSIMIIVDSLDHYAIILSIHHITREIGIRNPMKKTNETFSFEFRYLFHSQLSGESNPEAYNRALLAGCRAVELDCYDGHNGQPIVTHAYTLVKPCSFESIIRYIEPNLFKASP